MASGGGAGGGGGGRVVGDYMLGRQIGTGAFSIVWRARHRLRGTEVAVKEIVMDRLSKKLQDNLLSEVSILRRINHPNIIALYDFVQVSGRIYLVLEYCKGGDLSVYIQNHGRIPEATAKHFMRQLASGLQVLRDNNVIHRDLKPQNLLISTYDDNAVLKIADFGFARSLQPRGLAETLCGSPLYMAPEVMQSQKYDAKADLWSVGVILYQLVTGKTPFTGNSQLQLQQNIMKANELHFPSDCKLSRDCIDLCQKLLRRNAVERLTFEEFFNHQFLSEHTSHGSETSRLLSHTRNDFPLECGQASLTSGSSHDDCLPFPLDDESSVHDINKSLSLNKGSMRCTYGFSVDNRLRKSPSNSPSKNIGNPSGYSSKGKAESAGFRHDPGRFPIGSAKEMNFAIDQRPINVSSKDPIVMDSLELDQDYVLVPGPPLDMSSSSVSASRIRNSPCKSETSPIASPHYSALSAPMPITGAVIRNAHGGSLGSHSSPASGTSQGSMDVGDVMEQPSADCMTRIRSLQQYTSVIAELVKDKAENGRQLDAFAMQLVILAIWKQGLAICHAQVASAIEGSVSQEIEREFLHGVGHAEELAMDVGHMAEATEMPDAIEMIFQSALTLGRLGAVDEMMGNSERASCRYSKAVCLLHFLLVEAPALALNPPFSLTNSDRHRLRSYIEVLSNRHSQSRFQRTGLKCEDQ